MHFIRGYETETHHSITRLSIYGIGDAPTFVIKRGMHAFVMEDRMGVVPTFVIKGDAPLATCISYTCIIGDAQ
jgi:hypothetical protein